MLLSNSVSTLDPQKVRFKLCSSIDSLMFLSTTPELVFWLVTCADNTCLCVKFISDSQRMETGKVDLFIQL